MRLLLQHYLLQIALSQFHPALNFTPQSIPHHLLLISHIAQL